MFDEISVPEWFNLREFDEFISKNDILEEVSVQTRVKLARAAKRTAKKRAFLRKARAKRRRSLPELRKRATRQIRTILRKRLFRGSLKKASYAQRARIDSVINKRKSFVTKLVGQLMPKVVKGESQRLKNIARRATVRESFILESDINPKNERVAAKLRKQKQRQKEQEIRQIDPSKMAMVVRDQSGSLLIVDKDSFESDKHTPIIKSQDMSYSVALRISQDPSFKSTLTSERILGQSGAEQGQEQVDNSGSQPQQQSIVQQQQQLSLPGGQPIRDDTLIDASNAKWVLSTSLNLLKGIDINQQVKSGLITPEQAKEFMFSENMQTFGNELAQKLAKEFLSTVGRSINEYQMIPVPREEMPVSELWVKYSSVNNFPKTDIAFIHNCVSKENKNNNCSLSGIEPNEQLVKINMKYGTSHLNDGKMNGDMRALFETVYQKMVEHLHGGYGSLLGDEAFLSEADKVELEKINQTIYEFKIFLDKVIGTIRLPYGNSMTFNRSALTTEEIIEDYSHKIEKIKIEVYKRLHDIFSNNRVAMKLFYSESLSGRNKFENSLGSSNYILAINDEIEELKMAEMTESLFDEMIDTEELTLDISFKCDHCGTIYEENAWQRTIEHYSENSMELPVDIDSMRMCGRSTQPTTQKESKFKNSSLKVLFEEPNVMDNKKPQNPADEFLALYYKNYLSEIQKIVLNTRDQDSRIGLFFNLFKTVPLGIKTTPVKLFDVIEQRDGIKITNLTVNGQQKFIKVMGQPVFVSDTLPEIDDMSESYSFAKRFISEYWVKKNGERDYKKEYRKYQGKKSQRKNRSKRVLARRIKEKLGHVKKGDGKDVDHKDGNPQNNSPSNLKVISKSQNRSKK
jgi:hypothetical protein